MYSNHERLRLHWHLHGSMRTCPQRKESSYLLDEIAFRSHAHARVPASVTAQHHIKHRDYLCYKAQSTTVRKTVPAAALSGDSAG